MGRLVWLGALLWLAACAPATDESAQEGIGTPETAVPLPDPTAPSAAIAAHALSAGELPGEYRLAGVDGKDIQLSYGITASIDGERIHLVADCVNMAWRYTFADGRLVTARAPAESCARGLTAEEEAIVAALDSAEQAVRTPANGIELSGGNHTVTLFSQ